MVGLRSVILVALAVVVDLSAASGNEPTFSKDVQGEWHALLGVPASHFGIKDEDLGLIGAKVRIEADRLTLESPGEKSEILLAAECKALAEQRVDAKQKPLPGREAETILTGKAAGTRRLIWAEAKTGVLHVKILLSEPKAKGVYQSSAFGGGSDTLYLALRRRAVPAPAKHDKSVDARRVLGKWTALAHYDDGVQKESLSDLGRSFSITPERIDELDAKGQLRRPPVGFWGTYRIAEPMGGLGAIDLQLESFAGGGDGLMGRAPSLYAFYGDDLLYIAYCEQPRRDVPEEKRPRTPRLRSDGSHNLFILERAKQQ